MDLEPTLYAFAACAVLAVVCGWLGARPWDPRKGPRMVPYRFLMLLFATLAAFLGIHALNQAGFKTGR
jgi:hypothetical protein